jgi:NADH:ubiquinone oxidoreductase subunit 5 (subunit L)/multisubunit Na+/H+ antiporter MnhA subunit
MAEALHPAASHHLPSFITAPGETDVLMVIMALILIVSVLAFGILFLRLHTLPERIAHRSHKLQFEIVAVLGLIALFTHMHIFWVAGLLLALIDFPDLGGWLGRIARSVEKIAGIKSVDSPAEQAGRPVADVKPDEFASKMPHENVASIRRREGTAAAWSEPTQIKELGDA